MDILSALKTEASKQQQQQQQLTSINSAMEILGGKNSVGRTGKGTRESQNCEGAKGAMAENQSDKENVRTHEKKKLPDSCHHEARETLD